MPIVLDTLNWVAVQLATCFSGWFSHISKMLSVDSACYSDFIPTCSECSTAHPAPGISAVRGESAMGICRQCHRKMGMF